MLGLIPALFAVFLGPVVAFLPISGVFGRRPRSLASGRRVVCLSVFGGLWWGFSDRRTSFAGRRPNFDDFCANVDRFWAIFHGFWTNFDGFWANFDGFWTNSDGFWTSLDGFCANFDASWPSLVSSRSAGRLQCW